MLRSLGVKSGAMGKCKRFFQRLCKCECDCDSIEDLLPNRLVETILFKIFSIFFSCLIRSGCWRSFLPSQDNKTPNYECKMTTMYRKLVGVVLDLPNAFDTELTFKNIQICLNRPLYSELAK